MRSLVLLLFTLLLSACATQPGTVTVGGTSTSSISLDELKLYLRGSFNWWGTVAAHQFKQGSKSNVWYTDVELIADGQPQDFKLADAVWSPDQTCGGDASVVTMEIGTRTALACGSGATNLRFIAPDNGTYRFILREESAGKYQLSIRQR